MLRKNVFFFSFVALVILKSQHQKSTRRISSNQNEVQKSYHLICLVKLGLTEKFSQKSALNSCCWIKRLKKGNRLVLFDMFSDKGEHYSESQ